MHGIEFKTWRYPDVLAFGCLGKNRCSLGFRKCSGKRCHQFNFRFVSDTFLPAKPIRHKDKFNGSNRTFKGYFSNIQN